MQIHIPRRRAAAAYLALAVAGFLQSSIDAVETQPPHVYARLQLLAAETELVRQEIGAPRDARPAVVVRGGEPRHNYFEALALNRKVQRLCFDLTGDEGVNPPPMSNRVEPADVFAVVDAAVHNMRRVKVQFQIPGQSVEPAPDERKTPSDVFSLVVGISRQVSLMLDTRPTPTAVYGQLVDAAGTASRLLASFPDAPQPTAPDFERGRTPADVHSRLVRCLDHLSRILTKSGQTTLEVDWKLEPGQIAPSDVYDVATLLVSELHYLETHFPRAPGSSAVLEFHPGRKLPSHNYQLAGLLEAQVRQLERQVEAQPDWLHRAKSRRRSLPFD